MAVSIRGKTGSAGADMSYRIRTTDVLPNGRICKKCNRPYHFAGVCRREGQPPPSAKETTSREKNNGSIWKGAGANGSVGSRTGAAKKVYNVNSGSTRFQKRKQMVFGQESKKAWMRNN
jgi:hypothetical protein